MSEEDDLVQLADYDGRIEYERTHFYSRSDSYSRMFTDDSADARVVLEYQSEARALRFVDGRSTPRVQRWRQPVRGLQDAVGS